MKKYLCALSASLLFFSCASYEPAPRYSQMLADVDPFSLGSVSISLESSLTARLKEVTAEMMFYPRENEVALEFRHEMVNYRQFWNETGRGQFIEALNRYKEDYANRTLGTRYSKSREIYGKVQGRFEWNSFKYTAIFYSSPGISLGYRFKNKAPYFCVLQRSAQSENKTMDTSRGRQSSRQMSIFYTRAQAEEVAKLFDQKLLLEAVGGAENTVPVDTPQDASVDWY